MDCKMKGVGRTDVLVHFVYLQSVQGYCDAAFAQGRTTSAGEPERGKRAEAAQVVCKDQLGTVAEYTATGESRWGR